MRSQKERRKIQNQQNINQIKTKKKQMEILIFGHQQLKEVK